MIRNQKGFASIAIVILVVAVALGLGYFAFKKIKTPNINEQSHTAVTQDICTKEKDNIINLVMVFENLQTRRNAPEILKLFTAPKNQGDSVAFESLLGSDAAAPRLYSTGLTNFTESSYKILQQPSKTSSNTCVVKVEEWRSYQAHGIGSELGPSPPTPYIFYLVLVEQNGEWKIDSYLSEGGSTHKFSGWGY